MTNGIVGREEELLVAGGESGLSPCICGNKNLTLVQQYDLVKDEIKKHIRCPKCRASTQWIDVNAAWNFGMVKMIEERKKITHELKIDRQFFHAVVEGEKNFEIRKNDRNFKVGDILNLREWSEETGYTTYTTMRRVTYILDDSFEGITEGYVCMGIEEV